MLRLIVRVLDAVNSLTIWLGALSLIACCLLILTEIVLRGLFRTTTGIHVEYSIYLFIFLVFAALARAQSSGAMIYVELGYDHYPPRIRGLLDTFRWTLGLAFCATATYYLWHFTRRTCELGQLSMFSSQTPLCWPQSIMVAGMVFLTLEYVRGSTAAWWRLLTGRVPHKPEPHTHAEDGI